MSAIWGIVRFDDRLIEKGQLSRMGATMAHRAPDGSNSRNLGRVGLGHGLLKITREDRFDRQPVVSDDADLAIVADVRLDNREELADALGIGAAQLATMPDSLLILAAYRRWGNSTAEHLLGDFAFAIWDGAQSRLLLGRDHMGQRYLHYYCDAHFVAFATEWKALHALSDVPRNLDDAAVARWLMRDFNRHDSQTVCKGIEGVPGGAWVSVGRDGVREVHEYWTPQPAPDHLGKDLDYYVAEYRKVLGEAVAARLCRLDTPPGLLLSGGFDSTAIAAVAANNLPTGHKLVAVTAAGPDGTDLRGDARHRARWTASHMSHVDHHYYVRGAQGPLDSIDFSHLYDGVPHNLVPTFDQMYRRLASRGVRMVMDGVGGDATLNPRGGHLLATLFDGGRYWAFLKHLWHERRVQRKSLAHLLRRQVFPFTWLGRRIARRRRAHASDRAHPYGNPDTLRDLTVRGELTLSQAGGREAVRGNLAARKATLHLCQQRARPHGTNEAAVHGMELTRPMFDKRVVEFGLAVPEELQIVGGRSRYLAIRALGEALPPELAHMSRDPEVLDPDFSTAIRDALPTMRAEIERMRDQRLVTAIVDTNQLAADAAPERADAMNDAELSRLMRAFTVARYIAWFNRLNL